MRTIVFDMMGLVAGFSSGYPNLEELLIKPLSRIHDIKFGFWTRDRRGDYRFREWGSFFIGKEDIQDLGIAVQTKNQELILEICRRTKLQESLMDMEKLIPRWEKWVSSEGVIFDSKEWRAVHKYPPLLGNECGILIESDLGRVDALGKIKRASLLSDESLAFARKTNSSIILVPEYPDIWEGNNCSVTPAEVLDNLRYKLLHWQGEQIVADLGLELGIYSQPSREKE